MRRNQSEQARASPVFARAKHDQGRRLLCCLLLFENFEHGGRCDGRPSTGLVPTDPDRGGTCPVSRCCGVTIPLACWLDGEKPPCGGRLCCGWAVLLVTRSPKGHCGPCCCAFAIPQLFCVTSAAVPHYFHSCSALPPHCFRTASALPPHCFRTASALLPHCFRTTSALLPHCFRTASALLPHCFRTASALLAEWQSAQRGVRTC